MSRPALTIVILLYAAMLSGVVWGMFYARDTLAPGLAGHEGQAAWNEWRDEATAQAKEGGPVARSGTTSAEPPVVVLMRDYFVVCLVGAVIFSSLLFFVTTFLVRGALSTSNLPRPTNN